MKTDCLLNVIPTFNKMNPSKYVPPHMRNNSSESTPQPVPPRSRYTNRKSQWQLEKEEEEQRKVIQQQELEKKKEFNEDNFPTLGSRPTGVKVWGEKKTFATLAVEWNKKAEQDVIEQTHREKEEQEAVLFHRRANVPLPRFHNVHRFVEPEDGDGEFEEEPEKSENQEEGWTLVDRAKHRRQKTLEEKLARPPTPDNDGTVWNRDAPSEHETCWDERH
jgi:hypothetical protein